MHEHKWKKRKGRSLLYTLQEEVRKLFIFIKTLTMTSTFNLAKTFYSQVQNTCTQNCIRHHNALSRVLAFSKCKRTYFLNYLLSLLTCFKKRCVHDACQHGKSRATLWLCVWLAHILIDVQSRVTTIADKKGKNVQHHLPHIFSSLCGSDLFILFT